MKRTAIAKTFTIAAAVALALSIAPPANAGDRTCSNDTLKGTFVLNGAGVIISPAAVAGPTADVNTLTFDGNGAVTAGAGILVLNGNIIPVTQTGTYKVSPDCTGTYEVLISPESFTAHYFFVIDERGELQVICTDAGVAFTGVGRRQFPVAHRPED